MKRKDAVLINDPDPFHSITPYVMPKRTEAEVSSTVTIDVTKLLKFLDKKNKKGEVNYKFFHAFCTAVARTIYARPKLNIFIAGRKFWQRKDITLSFVAKQQFKDEAVETLLTVKVTDDMNLDKMSKIILGDINRVRKQGANNLDAVMNFVGKLPRPILEIMFYVLSRLEYHGIFPESLQKGDPNYTTCLLSNLGSIKADSCYHHLSNYGTNSMMITIGTIFKEGNKDKVHVTINMDERIADGFYFAKSFKFIEYLFDHPELLMDPMNSPIPEDFKF